MKTFQEWLNIREGREPINRKLYDCPYCHEKSAYMTNGDGSFDYTCTKCRKQWSKSSDFEASPNAGVSGRTVSNKK